MDDLIIEATSFTPDIHFNAKNNELMLKGRSHPENALEFYEPINKWLNEYLINANDPINMTVKLEYFNSPSSKVLVEILKKLFILKSKGIEVVVNWICEKSDEDMKDVILAMSELTEMPINIQLVDS